MKKKVRVYKPGGEAAQPTQEEIVNYIAQRMSSDDFDGDTDTLKEELAQAGIDEVTAEQYIEYVNENLGLSDQSQTVNPEDAAAIAAEEEQAASDEEQALLNEQNAAEEQARQEQMAAMYDTGIDTSADEAADDEALYMQYGGSKPSKRSFINKYTKLAKKQMGGDATNHTQGPDTKPATNFLSAVANTAKDAVLKQEAEQAYNSIYGAPQVGAFQDGGINPEQIDTESPLDHWTKQSQAMGDIFKNNQNIQNDMPHGQFGGFTDTNSGLYRFIGGGDNEYIDEQYQDADLDYPQYAKHGGALHKYQEDGETTEDWKAKYDELVKQNAAGEALINRSRPYGRSNIIGGNFGGGNFPITRNRYNQAIGNPYYTTTGEELPYGTDISKLTPTSTVTKKGLFGRDKEITVNFRDPSEYLNAPTNVTASNSTAATPTNQAGTPSTQVTNPSMSYYPGPQNDQRFARRMMNSGIPVIQGIGSYFVDTKSPSEKELFNDKDEVARVKKRMSDFIPIDKLSQKTEATKAYGGPIDYTEYAYGGDISVPELYRAQAGVEQKLDPNDNSVFAFKPLSDAELEEQSQYDPAVPEQEQPELTDAQNFLKYQRDFNQMNTYAQKAKTADAPGVGTTSNPIYQKDISQKFKPKSEWNVDGPTLGTGIDLAENAIAGTLEKAAANKQQNQLNEYYKNTINTFGTNDQYNVGTYGANLGDLRSNDTGFMGVVKYGGGIYAMGGNTEDEGDDIQYMTEKEIKDFLANGGELEYL